MKLYIVTNSCAYIVGVYDTEASANAARVIAEFNGVVNPYIETVELNKTNTGE